MARAVSYTFGTLFALALAVAAIAVIGAYTFLPPVANEFAARAVQDRLNLENAPEVALRSDPPPKMLLGEFSGGRVVLEEAEFGGLRTEEVALDLDPFRVDLLESARSRSPETRAPIYGALRVKVPEAEVRRIAEMEGLKGVEIEDGAVVLRFAVGVLGTDVPVAVRGEVGLRGDELVYRPRRIAVVGELLPEGVSREVFRGVGFSFRLQGFPAGTEITGVRVEAGRLVLRGEINGVLGG